MGSPRNAPTGAIATAPTSRQQDARQPESSSYPPLSAIPVTGATRLDQARTSESATASERRPEANTVLYLAYGSNLCAETFLGVRGIRPLSQVNVTVPTLRLTFDLPGFPYKEPCFANVDWRKLPKKPEVPDVPDLPNPHLPPPPKVPEENNPASTQWKWNGELVGVVYEVTREDYAKIYRTEGGGTSYHEIAVPCLPIPPKFAVPEKPTFPDLPKPFIAKTLFAPYWPNEELPDDPRKDKWWFPYITPVHRPAQDYAQPSLRYIKLLRDGAREHDLPDAYQEYLDNYQPYTITSLGQQIGALLLQCIFTPMWLMIMLGSKVFADKNGKLPPWLAISMLVMMNVGWKWYDLMLKSLCGDGERTVERKQKSESWLGNVCSKDEEKAGLLDEKQE